MLTIDLGVVEYFDGYTNQFKYEEIGIVNFEYSLKVIYEWESKWKKPFLKGDLNQEETLDFYVTMALDPIDPKYISSEVMEELSRYISDSQTATTFSSVSGTSTNGAVPKAHTSEEIYALMFTAGVPLEFENRNLNRLLTVLKIISAYNNPPKKMSNQDILRQNAQLNAQRKAQLATKG